MEANDLAFAKLKAATSGSNPAPQGNGGGGGKPVGHGAKPKGKPVGEGFVAVGITRAEVCVDGWGEGLHCSEII